MSLLLNVLVFALGVYLSIRTIAALYRILDLWYTMRTAWPQVLRGIFGWGGTSAVVAWLLAPAPRAAFLWGMAGYLAFYLLAGTIISRILLPKLAERR